MFRIQSSLAGLIFSLLIALLTALMVLDIVDNLQAYTADVTNARESLRIQPCVNEDASDFFLPNSNDSRLSISCQWNAKTQGNGLGDSFWVDTNNVAHYYL